MDRNPAPPPLYARVAINLPLKQPYTYRIPEGLCGRVQLGHAVLVPFGPRSVVGYVLEVMDTPDCDPERLKSIRQLQDPVPVFEAPQLVFFQWMADYYLAGLGEVIATALPSAFKGRSQQRFYASDEGVEALASREAEGENAETLREVVSRPGLTRRGLERRLRDLMDPGDCLKALDSLLRQGWVDSEVVEPGRVGSRIRVLHLELPAGSLSEHLPRAGSRMRSVVATVAAQGGSMDLPKLLAEEGPYARTAVNRLVEAGVFREESREIRDAVSTGELPANPRPPTLTAAQTKAVTEILGEPGTWLLHGVTGSGKTEVYLHAAEAILARGKQVLVLVPEIGLTPQLTGRFRARFGDGIAVLHSGLSQGQRLREWRRIRAGEATVAIGARSALFAPFPNLGLVVVDEEHDDSYKQDEGVRYSARDLAVVLGKLSGCAVVLGSATPSLESYQNAIARRYGLLELLERPTPKPVPEVELVDLNEVPRVDGQVPLISEPLREALHTCFANQGKAIVLYNRRGYATFVQCTGCGGSYSCPSCGISLVLHQKQRTLICHYCGFHRKAQDDCPQCGSPLEVMGRGTERVEEVLAEAFPNVAVGRMDADTTAARGAHHQLLEDFAEGRIQLLVGTQIVAKGHDFPDVHVAAVLGADHVLRMPDFRSAERCFSLLTQLAGRAGRGEKSGRVFVQTHHPEHFALQMLGNYRAFFEEESRVRHLLSHPPWTRLSLLRVEGASKGETLAAAYNLASRLRDSANPEIQVLGPAPAALTRLVGRWRYQILLRGKNAKSYRSWLSKADLSLPRKKGIRLVIDVDPRHLL